MDTSETYIKMCEKAFKDIGIFPDNGCPSQFTTKDIKLWGNTISLGQPDNKENIAGQIYRQDQLQEMVKRPNLPRWWVDLSYRFYKWAHLNWNDFTSLEQLWLAFVMHEKYQKKWNGEDWVLAKEQP